MTDLFQDLRYTLRQWRKSPGFAAAWILTWAFVAAPMLLIIVALAASFALAHRATKVSPLGALRYE